MTQIMDDERYKWLRQRVVMALELPTQTFDDFFTDSLERAMSAGINRQNITDYLSNKHGNGSILFFACQKWTEEIAVE
jgi:predicted oxidoreductase (fatty acid repression mutant protein)